MNYDSLGRSTKKRFCCRHRNSSVLSLGSQQKTDKTNSVHIAANSNNKTKTSYDTRSSFFQNIAQNIICFILVIPAPFDAKYWGSERKGCLSHQVKRCQICVKVSTSISPGISWKIMGIRYKRAHIVW